MDDDARLATIRARLERDLEGEQIRRAGADVAEGRAPSRWVHVPLLDLIKESNPTVRTKAPGKFVTGHQPVHPSASGTCLVIWTTTGYYWCSSCKEGGDAATWLVG